MKKIALLLFTASLSYSFPVGKELVYDVKIAGFSAGTQRILTEEREDEIRIVSKTTTNWFFSKFYKVDDYVEAVIDKRTLLPKYLFSDINEGRYHRRFRITLDQDAKIGTISSKKPGSEEVIEAVHLPSETFDILSLIHYLTKRNISVGSKTTLSLVTGGRIKRVEIAVAKERRIRVKGRDYRVLEVVEKREGIKVWLSNDKYIPLLIKIDLKYGALTAILRSILAF